jgi:hypothetical protein
MLQILFGILLSFVIQAPQETGVVEGTVRRGGTSDPIGGVELSLVVPGSRTRIRTVSDEQGRFTFEALPLGQYTLQASREGYFTYPRGQELPAAVAPVRLETRRQQLFIDLVPGVVFAGRVTDPQGQPVQGVRISAMELQYKEGRPAFGVGSVPKTTDGRGEFRLTWFPPGEYYVRAEYLGDQTNLARKSFYPGTVDSVAAMSFRVSGGETIEGLNFVLPVTSSVRISGRVIPDGAGPASGFVQTFYLLPLDGRPLEFAPLEFSNLVAPTAVQGGSLPFALDLRGVTPGRYDLAPFYMDSGNNYHSGRTRIEIEDRDLQDISAVINPNVHVSGRFIVEDDPTFRNFSGLTVHLRSKDAAVPLMTRTATARVDADGTFTIRDVFEGRYQIHLNAASQSIPSDLYISGLRHGTQDIRNDGVIDVRPSSLPVEIQLRAGAGAIQGTVEGPDGRIPSHADVVLIPQFPFRENVLFYDRTTASDKAEFKFEGIAPGDYKVIAFEQLADTAERNPAFIARYETLGESVTVRSRSTMQVRIRLVRS